MSHREFLIIFSCICIFIWPITEANHSKGLGDSDRGLWVKLDSDLLVIYEKLRILDEKPRIVMEKNKANGYFNPLSAFTGHYSLLSDDNRLIRFGLFEEEVKERRKDIEIFYTTGSSDDLIKILKKYNISYVIDDGSLKAIPSIMKILFANSLVLYKVE